MFRLDESRARDGLPAKHYGKALRKYWDENKKTLPKFLELDKENFDEEKGVFGELLEDAIFDAFNEQSSGVIEKRCRWNEEIDQH